MKDWRNTMMGALVGGMITLCAMYVTTTRTMVTEDQIRDMATKQEVLMIKELSEAGVQNSLDNNARAIERLADEVHNLREQVGKLEGEISRLNGH